MFKQSIEDAIKSTKDQHTSEICRENGFNILRINCVNASCTEKILLKCSSRVFYDMKKELKNSLLFGVLKSFVQQV